MKIKLSHWLIISAALALSILVSACAHKNPESSTGPSYQKSNKVVTDKSLNDQVLSVRHHQEKIVGHLYTAKSNVKHRPIAIVSHGLGGNYQELEAYARRLAKRGYLAYAFDFPGGSTNGQSTGLKQTQMSIYTEEQSLLTVIAALRSRKDVDKNNVLLVGGSQGGVVSALTASQHPAHIRGLALMYPAFSITHDAQARYHSVDQIPQESDIFGFSVGKAYYQKLLNIDITKVATKYRGPVLIVHGTGDDVVPIKYVEWAAHNFPNATFKKITGAGHGFEGSDQRQALRLLDNFVTKTQKHSERG